MADKADTSYVNEQLAGKADASDVTALEDELGKTNQTVSDLNGKLETTDQNVANLESELNKTNETVTALDGELEKPTPQSPATLPPSPPMLKPLTIWKAAKLIKQSLSRPKPNCPARLTTSPKKAVR